jgi:hypothetical protein
MKIERRWVTAGDMDAMPRGRCADLFRKLDEDPEVPVPGAAVVRSSPGRYHEFRARCSKGPRVM